MTTDTPPGNKHAEAVGEGSIRRLFPLFVLCMWIVLGVLIAKNEWTGLNTVLLIEAAVICAVVFVNFVYVFNYGYATSIIVLNVTILVVRGLTPASALIAGLLILYGIRLWWFTNARYRSAAYAGTRAGLEQANKSLPSAVKGFVYTQSTTLMTFHAFASYNVATRGTVTPWVVAGAVLIAAGLLLESVADLQKQSRKAADPSRFVSSGVFSRTRHPNYLGEVTFQVGIVVAGIGAAAHWYGYAAMVLGPIYIIALMATMVQRGELTKKARYGDDPTYAAYTARSGAFLPKP